MKRTIRVNLTAAGIKAAASELTAYASDYKQKCIELRNAFAKKVLEIAQGEYAEAFIDDIVAIKSGGLTSKGFGLVPAPLIPMSIETNKDYAAVIAGDVAIFLEFGTGIFYNGAAGSSPHPLGAQLGYTIGNYPPPPSKGRRKAWGFYEGDAVYITHGTPAQKILYRSVRLAQPYIKDLAKEIFT